jgi:hypothetical protein
MAKKSEVEVVESERRFIDRTGQHWFIKRRTNQVIFCNSIADLINGEHKTIEFTEKLISTKIIKKDDKEIEKHGYVLFFLTDGSMILAYRSSELLK